MAFYEEERVCLNDKGIRLDKVVYLELKDRLVALQALEVEGLVFEKNDAVVTFLFDKPADFA